MKEEHLLSSWKFVEMVEGVHLVHSARLAIQILIHMLEPTFTNSYDLNVQNHGMHSQVCLIECYKTKSDLLHGFESLKIQFNSCERPRARDSAGPSHCGPGLPQYPTL
jgi:hypothetical protein